MNFSAAFASIPGPVLGLLAFAGVLAILARLGRSLLRVGITAAEETAAAGIVEASARRGDLTTMAERSAQRAALRRTRWRQLAVSAAWAGLLVLPPMAGWGQAVYAACTLLWVLPRTPIRRGTVVAPPER